MVWYCMKHFKTYSLTLDLILCAWPLIKFGVKPYMLRFNVPLCKVKRSIL